MDFFNNIIKNVDINKISNLNGDLYELALSRMVCIEASKYYYRDEIFFLFKENIKDRLKIYNADPFNGNKNITCFSLCKIVEKILREIYGLNASIPTFYTDKFAHKDVILTTKSNKKFVINPLDDLVEYKVGFETSNFASKKMSDYYKKFISDIDHITEEQLLMIDEFIGYSKKGKYNNLNGIKCENLDEVIKTIISNKGYINGIVDLKIFCSLAIKNIYNKNLKIIDIYFDKNGKNDIINLDFNNNERYRGLIINDENYIYLFPINGYYNKFSLQEWNDLVDKYNIKINEYAFVESMPKLKEYGIDRNLLHNRQFLKIFNYYENFCKEDGYNILDYIEYTDSFVRINYQCDLLLYIEENNLAVIDFSNKNKEVYRFEDENKIVKEKMVLQKELKYNLNDYKK